MKREVRAGLPAPAATSPHSEGSRRCSRVGCENVVKKKARKFCSVECSGIAHRKHVDHGPIPVELLDEMQAALDELLAQIEATS